MGNRKNRGGNSSHQQHHRRASDNGMQTSHHSQHSNNNYNHHNNNSSSNNHNNSDKKEDGDYVDLNKVLQEIEGGVQLTWQDVVLALMGVAMLAALSIFVGIAAGMTISIHYYESESPIAVRRMDARDTSALYSGRAAYQKVTTLDPQIASSNVLQKDRDGLDLGKVITTSASGQLNVLMVVEETTPLHDTATETPGGARENNSQGYMDDTANAPYASTSHATPLTTEQANAIVPGYDQWKASQPDIQIREPTVLPTLCSDGRTLGFDNWNKLKAAVQEANSISAQRFMKWSAYFAVVGKSFSAFEDDSLYYEQDVVFSVCPGATLRARRGPIHINAANIIIECDQCKIDVGGTHLNFGPHAKNALVRGVTFQGAHTSSLTFFNDGADASFEDCRWVRNSGISGKYGAVADVNSTSTVNFYRCEISQGSKMSTLGQSSPGSVSSLSIRT